MSAQAILERRIPLLPPPSQFPIREYFRRSAVISGTALSVLLSVPGGRIFVPKNSALPKCVPWLRYVGIGEGCVTCVVLPQTWGMLHTVALNRIYKQQVSSCSNLCVLENDLSSQFFLETTGWDERFGLPASGTPRNCPYSRKFLEHGIFVESVREQLAMKGKRRSVVVETVSSRGNPFQEWEHIERMLHKLLFNGDTGIIPVVLSPSEVCLIAVEETRTNARKKLENARRRIVG